MRTTNEQQSQKKLEYSRVKSNYKSIVSLSNWERRVGYEESNKFFKRLL